MYVDMVGSGCGNFGGVYDWFLCGVYYGVSIVLICLMSRLLFILSRLISVMLIMMFG